MNVLFISELANLGGGETSLLNLMTEFNNKEYGVNPILMCFSEGKLVEESKKNGIETIIINLRDCFKEKNIKEIIRIVSKMNRLLRDNNIKVIQTNEWKTAILVSAICKLFFIKCKVIWICHGQWYAFNKIKSSMINIFIDKIISVSKIVKENLKDNGIDENIIVQIPLGIDINKFNNSQVGKIREEFKLQKDEVVFGIIGRFQEIKGQQLIVDCAKILKEKNIKCKFMMVGDSIFGSSKDDEYKEKILNDIKEYSLEEYFIFAGVRRDIGNILKDINALVIPSINESFGMTVIEAFAVGCVVISTPCDGPSEIIKQNYNGYLLKKRNVNELLKYINFIIEDKINIFEVTENQQNEVYKYSIENICKRYVEVFKNEK